MKYNNNNMFTSLHITTAIANIYDQDMIACVCLLVKIQLLCDQLIE